MPESSQPKVCVILVLYNSKMFVERVFGALLKQTHANLEIVAVINSDDGAKDLLRQKFSSVKIIEPSRNIGFAAGNNLAIKTTDGEFIQLINPDLIATPTYIEEMVRAFADPKVGAATGKLLRYDFNADTPSNILDSTGITMSASGRAKDRGQLQEDKGQFDNQREVFGVSGAGPMYRRSALEAVRHGATEYLDEDFGSYWEDADLSWRLNNHGYKNVYRPEAVAYHGRKAGQSKGGYFHLFNFIRHHKQLPTYILRLNYKNHILMYLKNAKFIHPLFLAREFFMLGYVLVFEPSTLGVIPELIRQIPLMRAKRK